MNIKKLNIAQASLIQAECAFRKYAELHAAKPDLEKAKRNEEFADVCASGVAAMLEAYNSDDWHGVCVSCGEAANKSTPDGAEMCPECYGDFNATAFDNLKDKFVRLLRRDYPNADIERALDEIAPLPDKE